MSRLSTLVLASLVMVGTAARADTFAGWRYTAPRGFVVEVAPDHVGLTKLSGSSFCSIALFEARSLDGPVARETAYEWYNVVTHSFDATVTRRATLARPDGGSIAVTTARLVDADGNRYAAVHYAVMPPGMIGSVLVTSSTPQSLRACERTARAFATSLAIDWSSPRFHDPEARVETPVGTWSVVGPTRRGYTFGADGSYRFHSEASTGSRDRVVDEHGTYAIEGNQLTLRPVDARAAVVEHGIARTLRRPTLEKATYTWSKAYRPDANEWQLILTPRKPTTRDGKVPTDASRPDGYRYSDKAEPGWKYAPAPGA